MKASQQYVVFEGRRIPIYRGNGVPGAPVTLCFSGGEHGRREAGRYQFWDIASPHAVYGLANCLTMRVRENLSFVDRLNRARLELKELPFAASVLDNAVGIWPSTDGNVARWLCEHPKDSPFVALT